MSTDVIQSVLEAFAKIVDNDAPMRALCEDRTSNLAVPFDPLAVMPALPVIVFHPQKAKRHATIASRVLMIECSAFARMPATANEMADRLEHLFYTPGVTPSGFTTYGAPGTCQDPVAQPEREWVTSQPDADDEAPCRADISLSFLLPD